MEIAAETRMMLRMMPCRRRATLDALGPGIVPSWLFEYSDNGVDISNMQETGISEPQRFSRRTSLLVVKVSSQTDRTRVQPLLEKRETLRVR